MKKFWNWLRNDADGESELYLDGAIASETWWGDEVTPAAFQAELKQHTGDVTVWINSPGGDVFAAAQIYTMLRNHPGKVTVKIHGIAASAASVVAMAGDTTLISPVGMLMIHNPSTMAAGEKKDMEQAITVLEEVKESILNAYAAKTGLSRNRLAKMMDAETWLNANEAMRLGFVDGILFAEDNPDKSRRKNRPKKSPKRIRTNPKKSRRKSRTNPTRKNPLHRRIPGNRRCSRFWQSWGRAKATKPWTLHSCVQG